MKKIWKIHKRILHSFFPQIAIYSYSDVVDYLGYMGMCPWPLGTIPFP